MKEARAPNYLEAERLDQERLEVRGKKVINAPENSTATAEPDIAAGEAEALQATAEDTPAEPLSAEAGIELEDTSFRYGDQPFCRERG